jgi:hypothetical protein
MEELTNILTAVLREVQQRPQQTVPAMQGPPVSVDIPPFDPSKNDAGAAIWCDDVQALAAAFKWTDFEQLCRAASVLQGDAKEWYDNWHPANKIGLVFEPSCVSCTL